MHAGPGEVRLAVRAAAVNPTDTYARNGTYARNAGGEPELQGVGTGNGLGGLRERIDACGGTLDAGPTADGGWRVAARIPRRSLAKA